MGEGAERQRAMDRRDGPGRPAPHRRPARAADTVVDIASAPLLGDAIDPAARVPVGIVAGCARSGFVSVGRLAPPTQPAAAPAATCFFGASGSGSGSAGGG